MKYYLELIEMDFVSQLQRLNLNLSDISWHQNVGDVWQNRRRILYGLYLDFGAYVHNSVLEDARKRLRQLHRRWGEGGAFANYLDNCIGGGGVRGFHLLRLFESF